MPATLMLHARDPRQALIEKVGSVEDVEVFHNQVLVAVYIAPEQTAGGIFRPQANQDEDRYQGKMGLILKVGPRAFEAAEGWSWPDDMGVGDWVYFRPSDTLSVTVNGHRDNLCRLMDDVHIRGRAQHPDQIW